jgi:NAD(P)H-hydrate epimerase
MTWTTEQIDSAAVPTVTANQMREVDRLLMEEAGISLLQMMEQAGRHLARLAQRLVPRGHQGCYLIVAGSGNNGGGGLVCARYLHNWGEKVRVLLSAPPERYTGLAGRHLQTLQHLGIPVATELGHTVAGDIDLVVDAMVGFGLTGSLHGKPAAIVKQILASAWPVLALDIPSGLDASTGIAGVPCIKAMGTLTLALPKTGLLSKAALPYVGDLFLADIGIPPAVYARLDIKVEALFSRADVIKICVQPII